MKVKVIGQRSRSLSHKSVISVLVSSHLDIINGHMGKVIGVKVKNLKLRIHDTFVPKMTVNMTFMSFLCYDFMGSILSRYQGTAQKVIERLVYCYF